MSEQVVVKAKRGFAAMSPEKQREIAVKGGKAAHAFGSGHEWTSEEASVAGKKGGVSVSRDRAHMAEIGRKGGTNRHKSLVATADALRQGPPMDTTP